MSLARKSYVVGRQKDIDEMEYRGEPNVEFVMTDADGTASDAKKVVKFSDIPFVEMRAVRYPQNDLFLFEGKELTKHHIQQIEQTRRWRREMERFVERHEGKRVRIYSCEHHQYWRAGGAGYTLEREGAGAYDIQDAWERTYHVDGSKGIRFELLNES